jgi:hypothetical protein
MAAPKHTKINAVITDNLIDVVRLLPFITAKP